MTKLKKCTKCKANDFFIQEGLLWKASVSDEGILEAYKMAENEIEYITCKKCGYNYIEKDFKDIQFTD